tara:strand:- start:1 stop:1098 length:1098 start_codon:yes stop_codon:yes gene_type:complete
MFPVSKEYINNRCGLHLDIYQQKNPDNTEQLGIINGNGKFTKCSPHKHISREKYDEVVPKIIQEFLDAGPEKTIEFFMKPIDIGKKYNSLKEDKVNVNEITAKKAGGSNEIIRKYMPHIYEVEDHKGVSINSLWTEEGIKDTFKRLDKPNYTVNSNFSEFIRWLKFNPVTIYSPIMAKSIISVLKCKTVFDPCIGWGGRMLGTTCLGKDYHYTGCEPFTKTFQGLEKMVKDMNLEEQVKLYNKPVEDVLEKIQGQKFDMCLTSPPYFDLEVYSHEDSQSIKEYETYEEWILQFIKPIIDYVCSHVTKYSCWSVKNFKTKEQYNLLDDVIKLHEENGWKQINEYSIKKVTKDDKSKDGDVTYVFQK